MLCSAPRDGAKPQIRTEWRPREAKRTQERRLRFRVSTGERGWPLPPSLPSPRSATCCQADAGLLRAGRALLSGARRSRISLPPACSLLVPLRRVSSSRALCRPRRATSDLRTRRWASSTVVCDATAGVEGEQQQLRSMRHASTEGRKQKRL